MHKLIFPLLLVIGVLMTLPLAADAQGGRKRVSAAEVNGTYRMNFRGKFSGLANEIKLLALGRGKIRFAMELVFPYTLPNGEIMVNMGEFDDEAAISGDTARFESTDGGACKFTFKFVIPETLRVTQEGSDAECGFGHNVFAHGTYRKVSGKKPSFEVEP